MPRLNCGDVAVRAIAAAKAPVAVRLRRSASRREHSSAKARIGFLLAFLRQNEVENRPQHILTWVRRAGSTRGGAVCRSRGLHSELFDDADGTQKSAAAPLNHPAAFGGASLIDQS